MALTPCGAVRRSVNLLRTIYPRLQVKEFEGMSHGDLSVRNPDRFSDELAAIIEETAGVHQLAIHEDHQLPTEVSHE